VAQRFTGKSVVITGAGAGIGLGYARAFAAEGAQVTIADIDAGAATAAAGAIAGSLAVAVDVADEASVAAMVAASNERFGGVDILVNNAGLHMGTYNQGVDLPLEDWRRLFDVNVFGSVLCTRHCRPSMMARGGGVVLNQSSNSSYLGVGAYSTSKAALNAVTLSLAQELAGDGIRVLGIAPGMVASDAVLARLDQPLKDMVLAGQLVKRFGSIDDLVGMVLLLCSDDAFFMTGQTVVVDGGYVRQL
jgi:NAD(P)-dependent dehydrogenase (short-subunit alcohol dehydrogenase family)